VNLHVENEIGTIEISPEVVATIAGASAIECYGLVGMASKASAGGIARLLKREHLTKGIKVHQEDDALIIDLFVIVQFGTKISVVADNIIQKVKYNVETQTGLKVKKVNLNIEGVRVQA
jgi:uncharacterized alkaline shock family protein YloU